jgi:anti-sigma factor RsiW
VAEHLSDDELADAAVGLVAADRAAAIEAHLAECPTCAERHAGLLEVERLLAELPAPTMPPDVAARLEAVVALEQQRRVATGPVPTGGAVPLAGVTDLTAARHPNGYGGPVTAPGAGPAGGTRATLGAFAGGEVARPARRHLIRTALVAAVAAVLVGFGGYVLSASVGLNEPSASAPVQISSADLAGQARRLAGGGGLSAHLFSDAWWCANRVTKGRVTGLVPAVVDGERALLVYSTDDGVRQVTIVRGCPGPGATAVKTVPLNG